MKIQTIKEYLHDQITEHDKFYAEFNRWMCYAFFKTLLFIENENKKNKI